jgi:DNA-binding transcriptional LysR family regulator
MRRQIAERVQLAGRRLTPVMEVEYLPAALDLVAEGFGDTVAPRAALAAYAAGTELQVASLAEPLYDTIALARRHGHPLSPATTEFARMAHEALVENSSLDGATVTRLSSGRDIDRFLA